MAASKKRRVSSKQKNGEADSESSSSDAEETPEEVVQVDFEARIPEDSDFHGIQKLLLQLFLKAHVDVSQLADILIQQNYISSVIKQCDTDEMETDADDIEKDVSFGIFSVINVKEKMHVKCVKQIHTYLLDHCMESCSKEDFSKFKDILESVDKPVGLLVSERFINIPPQISLPLYQTLSEDLQKAIQSNKPFNFGYFMMISKILVDKNKAEDEEDAINFVNGEEELFMEDAVFKFDFSVADQQDSGLCGRWSDSDVEWEPKRRVMLFPSEKWETLLTKLKAEFS